MPSRTQLRSISATEATRVAALNKARAEFDAKAAGLGRDDAPATRRRRSAGGKLQGGRPGGRRASTTRQRSARSSPLRSARLRSGLLTPASRASSPSSSSSRPSMSSLTAVNSYIKSRDEIKPIPLPPRNASDLLGSHCSGRASVLRVASKRTLRGRRDDRAQRPCPHDRQADRPKIHPCLMTVRARETLRATQAGARRSSRMPQGSQRIGVQEPG